MAQSQRDFYEVLGVSKSATADEIKSAHRKLARKYHPDLNRNDKSAETRFKEVQEAYDILSDAKKRQAYDQFGHAGVSSAAAADAAAAAAAAGRGNAGFRYSTRTPGGGTVDSGEVDLEDLFASMSGFGRRTRGGRGRGSTQEAVPESGSSDIVHNVTLSFEQAARGTTLELRFDTMNRTHSETISVKIPPGVTEGSKVRVRGRGQPSAMGQSRGDLIIITHIAPHPFFTRVDQDVLLELPISFAEALKGAVVRVPTLDGPVELRIPPGVNSGKKLRIKGRGIENRDHTKGDQLCRLLIVLPEGLCEQEIESLVNIDAAHKFDPRKDMSWNI
ncbi:MAG TPA: DnaJ C-terminal domain-containing protein [Phycisphaerae bacterium]|nr:DnaJ C-terminal domain-containing protein [Phycisphaerae bacterium]